MDRVMDVVKKNLLSIVCAVIALLAIVAAKVWPLPKKFDELSASVNARAKEYGDLESLARKERHLPITDPTDSNAKVLDMFPTQTAIDKAQLVTAAISKEGNAVLEKAVQMNEHQLLMPGILPSPLRSVADKFQEVYQAEMDYFNPDDAVRAKTLPYRVLRAGIPPTDAEITNERAAREKKITEEQLIPGPNGNQAAITKLIQASNEGVADDMRNTVAANAKMYMNPDAVDVYPGIMLAAGNAAASAGGGSQAGGSQGGGSALTSATIYYAQIGLWVQQDVFAALAKVNENASGIADAPVKHLIKIDVTEDAGKAVGPNGQPIGATSPYGGGQMGGSVSGGIATSGSGMGLLNFSGVNYVPAAVPGAEGTAATTSSKGGPTGRVNGPLYDVVPFHLVLNVDGTRIPDVLMELSRNKFITVTRADVGAINATAASLAGYRYGNGAPIVQLNLDCEMLFLKSWLTKYMPPAIANPPAPVTPQ